MVKNFNKVCSGCQTNLNGVDFLTSPELRVIGMACKPSDTSKAYFFFHHDIPGCGTSLLIEADKLIALVNDLDNKKEPNTCDCGKDFGITLDDLDSCQDDCSLVPYKELLHVMLKNKKLA
jgi:hypothetical protein